MSKQYKALKPIGRFKKDDYIGGFTEAEIKHHLAKGNIEEVTAKAILKKTAEVKNVE
ncbi:hypothetical protein [Acinetobacter defluvii]|uniref:hypothetical protein n=1 Tax=Acinetobacter defluvii TaxID=1871111 RepID=UPI0014903E22|nr:hypothetical protein [Acinetobacter defluvii]